MCHCIKHIPLDLENSQIQNIWASVNTSPLKGLRVRVQGENPLDRMFALLTWKSWSDRDRLLSSDQVHMLLTILFYFFSGMYEPVLQCHHMHPQGRCRVRPWTVLWGLQGKIADLHSCSTLDLLFLIKMPLCHSHSWKKFWNIFCALLNIAHKFYSAEMDILHFQLKLSETQSILSGRLLRDW